jgi:pyrroloquinoline-quinone synthase
MFAYVVKGIQKNTSVSEKNIEYFTLHIEEDKEHAKVFNTLIERHVAEPEGQRKLREGALRSLAYRKKFWDGLFRTVFGEEPRAKSGAS